MKKRLLILFLITCTLVQTLSFVSCSKKAEKFSSHSFDYFDTVTTITGYAESKEQFDTVSADVMSELGEYHKLFDIYKRYDGLENLCTINELKDGAHRTVKVDKRIIDMLLYAKDMYTQTNGKVNVAMGSVLSIWHDYREIGSNDPASATLPPMEKLIDASKHADITNLIIDEETSTVFLSDPEMKLDVGAIAKGYAVEMAAKSLEEKNISGYVINVGGNVRTVGLKGDGSKWLVGIENPEANDDLPYLAYLEISDKSLVTSGSYQRYYIVDGKRYHHIIDPETLMPSESYLSVSVLCENSAKADALSTALFCMPFEEGLELINSIDDAEAMWVETDGTLHYSDNFENYLSKNN